jgi:hypothetical protein
VKLHPEDDGQQTVDGGRFFSVGSLTAIASTATPENPATMLASAKIVNSKSKSISGLKANWLNGIRQSWAHVAPASCCRLDENQTRLCFLQKDIFAKAVINYLPPLLGAPTKNAAAHQ